MEFTGKYGESLKKGKEAPLVKNNVKELRLDKGWTITELAKRTELSAKTISKMEKGIKTSEVSKRKVANALKIKHERVFPEKKKKSR
jgi:transcriptional regulator with XRE-family HTH domain